MTARAASPQRSDPREGLRSSQKTVTVSDQGFKPDSLTIQTGDTVTFQWFGQNTNPHEVIIKELLNGMINSPSQRTGSFAVPFPRPGDYAVSDRDNAVFAATVVVIQ
jgi:plastocyanin